MTFDELQKANATISTTNIKGKEYAEVNERVRVFRQLYPEGIIATELVSNTNGVCVFKAAVFAEKDKPLASGYAYETENSTYINKTSYIENCETSAVGRALGFLGIGINTSIASADEVTNAINNQNSGADNQRHYDLEIKNYAAVLAKNSDKTAEEWIKAAQAKYKTAKAQSDLLAKWVKEIEQRKEV